MSHDFPTLPGFQAVWAPVYLEPIPGSGERVVCAVVVQGADGSVATHNVFDTVRLAPQAERLSDLRAIGDRVCESMESHLRAGGKIHTWAPPFSRVSAGSERAALGDHIWGLLQRSLDSSSSLHQLYSKPTDRERSGDKFASWRRAIRHSATLIYPTFAKCFAKSFRIDEQARAIEVDFIGRRAAYYFGHLSSGRSLQDAVNSAKAKLFNLEELRDFCERIEDLGGKLDGSFSFQLMLRLNAKEQEDSGVKEAIRELELAAKRRELGLETAHSPEEACALLIRKEAA